MRASSVGIDAIIASVSEITFLSGPSKVIIDFEDISLDVLPQDSMSNS
jgi:hypothetical protein